MILQPVQPIQTLGVLAVPLKLKSGKEQPGSPRFTRGLVPLVAPSRVCCIGKGVNFRGLWISAQGPLVTLAASWWHWRYDIVQPPPPPPWHSRWSRHPPPCCCLWFLLLLGGWEAVLHLLLLSVPSGGISLFYPNSLRAFCKRILGKTLNLKRCRTGDFNKFAKQKTIPFISTKFTSVCNLLIPIAFRQTLYLYQMQVFWYFRWQVEWQILICRRCIFC